MFEEINEQILLNYDFESVILAKSLSCWLVDGIFFKDAKGLEKFDMLLRMANMAMVIFGTRRLVTLVGLFSK